VSDEILVDIDGPVTAIRLHQPYEHRTLSGRELISGAAGDILGDPLAEFR